MEIDNQYQLDVCAMETAMTTLWKLRPGDSGVIGQITDLLDESVRLRLSELGFTPDRAVQCLRHTLLGGPRIFAVGDSVFSLAQDIAEHVEVSKNS